jgi:hypothetical protein
LLDVLSNHSSQSSEFSTSTGGSLVLTIR